MWLDALFKRDWSQVTPLFAASTGANVSPETAIEASTVWAAVRLISSTLATLPLPVYQHTNEGKEKARQHPNWTLLHDRPNPEQSGFIFRETIMAHLLLYGNAYAEIERNGAGQPVALWPIHPTAVRMERKNGHKLYTIRVEGQEVILPPDAMLHIPGFSLDGHTGIIPVHIARNAIGLAKATEEFGSKFFENGASPSGVLEHPGKLSAESADRLRKSWNAAHTGLSKAQRVAILEQGMTWKPLGVPPEHAQFLETRKFQVAEIARIFLIPPHLLADLERATFSNIEHQSIQYVVHCIEPWARRLEGIINWELFDNRDYFAEFNLDGLLRGDSATRAEFYTKLFNIGVYSPNDIREKENANRVPGGDQRFVPLNMAPLDQTLTDAARALIDAEVGRFVRRKAKNVVDEEFNQRQEAILLENLGPVLDVYFRMTGRTDTPQDYIRQIVRNS